ncbi:MAG: hypothetical protein ACR2FH_08905 [Caulobacteraceae bacterium]
MKLFTTCILAGALAIGGAGQASAFKLAPPSASFSASGNVNISTPGGVYECTLSIRGTTNKKGRGKITAAVFSPGASFCSNTTASGLVWKVKAVSATTAKILNLAIVTPFGSCGPTAVPVSVSGGGVWTINAPAPPTCTALAATLPTAPPIVIVP